MDIKTQAEIYAENFRLIPETKGWYQQKVDDFTAGYEAALRQFAVSGRSEQFVCEHLHRTEYAHLGKYKCEDCGKWMDKQTNCY